MPQHGSDPHQSKADNFQPLCHIFCHVFRSAVAHKVERGDSQRTALVGRRDVAGDPDPQGGGNCPVVRLSAAFPGGTAVGRLVPAFAGNCSDEFRQARCVCSLGPDFRVFLHQPFVAGLEAVLPDRLDRTVDGLIDSKTKRHHALDRGINYFDTAEGYTGGQSESVIGNALAGRRDKVFIASK